MFNFEFHNPLFLLLFLLFIPLIIKDLRAQKILGIKIPTIKNINASKNFGWLLFLLKITKYIILSALILAIARPQTFNISEDQDETKGIDIVLSVDISLSMLAKDLEPDRLSALKNIAKKFVEKRTNDRLGLVEYSGEAFMKVPLTTDYKVITDELSEMKTGELQAGTSIGEGLTVAVNHLKDSKAKSKIIILMTDGVNTIQNAMPPQIGAELAKNNNIKVYTIGIGTNGYALFPIGTDIFGELMFQEQKVEIAEDVLTNIANITNGKYFRATSNDSLEQIYDEINQLEKSDVKSQKLYNYQEYFRIFLWIALVFLLIDAFVRWRIFRVLN